MQNIDANFRVDLRRVFAHANQLSERAAKSERLTRALIINFPSPRKRYRLVAATVGDPAASRRRFGMLEQQTTADVHVDSLPGQLDHGVRDGGVANRKLQNVGPCYGGNLRNDLERQYRAPGF